MLWAIDTSQRQEILGSVFTEVSAWWCCCRPATPQTLRQMFTDNLGQSEPGKSYIEDDDETDAFAPKAPQAKVSREPNLLSSTASSRQQDISHLYLLLVIQLM